MNIFLDRPLTCPECGERVRQLYPLTRHNPKTGHWEPTKACLACLGPSGDDPSTIGSQFKSRNIQR